MDWVSGCGDFDLAFTVPTPLAQREFLQRNPVRFRLFLELPWVLAGTP